MRIYENGKRAPREKNNSIRNFGARLEDDINVFYSIEIDLRKISIMISL